MPVQYMSTEPFYVLCLLEVSRLLFSCLGNLCEWSRALEVVHRFKHSDRHSSTGTRRDPKVLEGAARDPKAPRVFDGRVLLRNDFRKFRTSPVQRIFSGVLCGAWQTKHQSAVKAPDVTPQIGPSQASPLGHNSPDLSPGRRRGGPWAPFRCGFSMEHPEQPGLHSGRGPCSSIG